MIYKLVVNWMRLLRNTKCARNKKKHFLWLYSANAIKLRKNIIITPRNEMFFCKQSFI